MVAFGITFLVGVICAILGAAVGKGKLSLLHDYHTSRVAEADKPIFGKTVGLGILTVGVAIALFSVLSATAVYTEGKALFTAGLAVLGAGLFAGIGIVIYALIRYNKGIF